MYKVTLQNSMQTLNFRKLDNVIFEGLVTATTGMEEVRILKEMWIMCLKKIDSVSLPNLNTTTI